jgi:hypothetical protein
MLTERAFAEILLVFFPPLRSLAIMKHSLSTALACVLVSSTLRCAHAESDLTLSADTPTAQVEPRSAERAPLVLPELEYNFSIQVNCHDNLEAASISLAVADTRRTFDHTQIASGELNAFSLRIPANQIAPVVIADFCITPTDGSQDPATTGRQLPMTLRSALSAQASLLCVAEGHQSMKYASAALDVQLVCEHRGGEAELPLSQ